MTPKEKALEKIRKLLTLAEDKSASEGEIENALTAAQKLMAQYEIEYSDVDFSADEITDIIQEFNPKKGEKKYWTWDLLDTVARSYSVKTLEHITYVNFVKVEFFRLYGSKTEVKIVQEIFEKTIPIIRNLANKRYREKCNNDLNNQLFYGAALVTPNKSKFFNDYVDGFVRGIDMKLSKQRKDLEKEDISGKYGLILVRKDELIQNYMESKNSKIKQTKQKERDIDQKTFNQGLSDGRTEHEKHIG